MKDKLVGCGARKIQSSVCLNDLRCQLRETEKLCIWIYCKAFEKVILIQTAGQLKEILKRTDKLISWEFWAVPEEAIVITED